MTEYKNIWVFAETEDGQLSRISLELLGAARQLANESDKDSKVAAVILGEDCQAVAKESFCYGADIAYIAESPFLKNYSTDGYAKVVSQAVAQHNPEIFLLGGTLLGRNLAPRVAAKVHTGLTADVTEMAMDNGLLVMTKPAYGEDMMSRTICENARPQMLTVRSGVVNRNEYKADATGEIIQLAADLTETDIRTKILETVDERDNGIPLTEAEIIICGGRGAGGKKGFKMLQELADVAGGAVGASRIPVNAGWVGQSMQIGQTGHNVAPKLFIACGVSGTTQFDVGMYKSSVIVAINKDPLAPIFNLADYYIVGDMFQIVPELIKQWDKAEELFFASKK